MVAPRIQLLPLGSGFSGQWGAGDAAGASGAQGLFHPQLGAQAAGALDVQGLVDLLVTDAHAPIIGVLEPQAGGDLPGTDPIPRAGRRPARAGPDWRPACGSWGGPTAPGPRPAPPPGGRPRPTPAPRRISRDTVCRHRPIRRAMRAAQVPLRQARGDHGPLTGPQAQAPTGAPRHPRVGSPVIRWPPGAPAPPSTQDLTAMRPLDGGNGAGGGTHTRIVQPPARGRDRHAPGPGGPGPPGPGGPGLEHRPPAPGGRQGALRPRPPPPSPTPAPRAHRPTAVRDTPSSRAAADADQPSAISSIARRRTSSATLTPQGTSTTPPNP